MAQEAGVYLVEYQWRTNQGQNMYHCVYLNCNLRVVFCNTLGAVPYRLSWFNPPSLSDFAETQKTHAQVCKVFKVRTVRNVWCLAKNQQHARITSRV